MAIAELHPSTTALVKAPAQRLPGGVRIGVHDASRVEWSFSIPLPEDAPLQYNLRVKMQIPSIVRQAPWEQLQSFTRLDGPMLTAARGEPMTIDALRRGALALVAKLSRARESFSRHCRLVAGSAACERADVATSGEIEDTLFVWLDAADRVIAEGRERFAVSVDGESAALAKERELLDEYMSVRYLEMLAGAERSLANLSREFRADHPLLTAIGNIECRVADALGKELLHRRAANYIEANPRVPTALERYLERSSKLKKHFQEVLFLEAETVQVADRIHSWAATISALIAGTSAFFLQVALSSRGSMGTQVSSGLVILALIGGVCYATRDRLKDTARIWMSGKVHRVIGHQRVARYRAPAKRLPARDVIVAAREAFDQTIEQVQDSLNPESGATMSVKMLEYRHRGTVMPQATLTEAGVRRVKHVFRYDMSPLFAHLDDAQKAIPVLDEETHRVRFVDAPRCYRIPITMSLECGGAEWSETATLVLHKRGLDRIERSERAREDSDPGLMDTALEPG